MEKNGDFQNVEFISIVKKMIKNENTYKRIDETKIYAFDAYVFIGALYTCIKNGVFSYDSISDDNLNFLFNNGIKDSSRKRFLKETNSIINKLEETTKKDFERARMNYMQSKSGQVSSDISGDEISIPDSSGMLKGMENGNAELGEKKTAGCEKTKFNAGRKDNTEIINKWHAEIDDISNTFKSIQPEVSKMLEIVMGFSDKITEKYILQFARMQIDLYNFISDNYIYHKKVSEHSQNQDYINAVSNYEEFLYSISDALAVFGVEEIVSYPGDAFDGKIHETESSDFSSRSAVIRKSIRSGYRYKDIIIQKEKVEI